MRYSDVVIDHFQNPRWLGRLCEKHGAFASFCADGRDCDDTVCFDVRLAEDRILDIRFRAFGCPPLIAAASFFAVQALGGEIGKLIAISSSELSHDLALAEPYIHAAELVLCAFRGAVGGSAAIHAEKIDG